MSLLENEATKMVLRFSPNGEDIKETWTDGDPLKALPVSVKWAFVPDSAYSAEAHLYGWVNMTNGKWYVGYRTGAPITPNSTHGKPYFYSSKNQEFIDLVEGPDAPMSNFGYVILASGTTSEMRVLERKIVNRLIDLGMAYNLAKIYWVKDVTGNLTNDDVVKICHNITDIMKEHLRNYEEYLESQSTEPYDTSWVDDMSIFDAGELSIEYRTAEQLAEMDGHQSRPTELAKDKVQQIIDRMHDAGGTWALDLITVMNYDGNHHPEKRLNGAHGQAAVIQGKFRGGYCLTLKESVHKDWTITDLNKIGAGLNPAEKRPRTPHEEDSLARDLVDEWMRGSGFVTKDGELDYSKVTEDDINFYFKVGREPGRICKALRDHWLKKFHWPDAAIGGIIQRARNRALYELRGLKYKVMPVWPGSSKTKVETTKGTQELIDIITEHYTDDDTLTFVMSTGYFSLNAIVEKLFEENTSPNDDKESFIRTSKYNHVLILAYTPSYKYYEDFYINEFKGYKDAYSYSMNRAKFTIIDAENGIDKITVVQLPLWSDDLHKPEEGLVTASVFTIDVDGIHSSPEFSTPVSSLEEKKDITIVDFCEENEIEEAA